MSGENRRQSVKARPFIGVMSGTSMDAIDACIVDFSAARPRVTSHASRALTDLHDDLRALNPGRQTSTQSGQDIIDLLGQLDIRIAHRICECIEELLDQAGLGAEDIAAIGCHGQTIRHRPTLSTPFTLQIGDPNTIAERTGIPVIADFRRRDMAAGGQGAPLVPPAHRVLFGSDAPDETLIAVNLGGICNITVSRPNDELVGFDTGPANTLMDAWIRRHRDLAYDEDGRWAASGTLRTTLLARLMNEPYFHQPAPKSTGPEFFNLDWLLATAGDGLDQLPPEDIQATLLALTAQTLTAAIRPWVMAASTRPRVILAGGGARNPVLVAAIRQMIRHMAPEAVVELSDESGIDVQCVECAAFAWLARQFLLGQPGNAPSVTGARGPRILGGYYPA